MYPHVEIDVLSGSAHARVVRRVGRDRRVLELGCATGYMSKALRNLGCDVVGVEIEPEAAARASEFCSRVIVADIESGELTAALGSERFDVVLAADVLEHLRAPGAVLRVLKDYLAPGGRLVACVPNVAHGSVRLALLQGRFPYAQHGLLDHTHLRFFTRESLLDLLGAAGLAVTDLERYHVAVEESEVPFDTAAVPSTLLDALSADVESTTYQFIVTAAVVSDAALAPPSMLGTPSSVDDSWCTRRKTLDERVPEASAELGGLRARAARADALQAQIDAMRSTRAWRLAAWLWRGEARARQWLRLPSTGWPPG